MKRIEYTLGIEQVKVVCEGVDQMVDGQPWDAVNNYYNFPEPPCGTSEEGVTLKQFFDTEYVGDVTTWFTGVTIPVSLEDVLLPEITTIRKGFLTVVQEIVKPYPYINFVIEFSTANTTFPVGQLVLLDLRAARSTHSLQVGGVSPEVVDLSVGRTIQTTAKDIRVFARGKFMERYELLTPDWDPSEEEIDFTDNAGVLLSNPVDEENPTLQFPEGHEFIREAQIFADNVDYVGPPGTGTITNSYRIFPGADFIINVETGEVTLLRPEEGDDWWWVNRETGAVRKTVSSNTLGNLEGTLWRRPVTYDNAHMADEARFRCVHYTYMGERPYRHYLTKFPIADLRIEAFEEAEIDTASGLPTGHTITKYRKLPNSIDIYIPKVAQERFLFEEDDTRTVDAFGFFGNPVDEDVAEWRSKLRANNASLGLATGQDPNDEPDQEIPEIRAHMLFPVTSDPPELDEVLRYYSLTETGVEFEEGTRCVKLGKRQVVSVPPVYEEQWDKVNEANPDIYTDWATWSVLAHYTSWEEIVEERTNVLGEGRVYTGVANSIFSYCRGLRGDTPEVVFDNTDELPAFADEVASYFGSEVWEGTVTVPVILNGVSDKFEVPFKIGDTVTLTGETPGALATFVGYINSLDYSRMDSEHVVTVGFGAKRPKKNPYLPVRPFAVDIEGDEFTGPDAGGLQDYGDN